MLTDTKEANNQKQSAINTTYWRIGWDLGPVYTMDHGLTSWSNPHGPMFK
jgi:hypothetical protein